MNLENIALSLIYPILQDGTKIKIGKFDNTKEKIVLLKDHERQINHNVYNDSKKVYEQKHLQLIIRWNDSYSDTEEASEEIYNKLKNIKNFIIDDTEIIFIKMDNESSKANQRSEEIFERYIDFVIYYKV